MIIRKSNIFFKALLVFTILIAGVIVSSLYISKRFKTSNQEKRHLQKLKKVGSAVDNYWVNKLEILDELSNDTYINDIVVDADFNVHTLNSILDVYKRVAKASIAYMMDLDGNVVGSSKIGDSQKSLLGNNYSFRPYFVNALRGDKVVYPAVGVTTMERGMYLSKAINLEGKNVAVVVLKLPLDFIDSVLKSNNFIASIVSPDGIVFASSIDDWLYHSLNILDPSILKRLRKTRQFADIQPRPLEYDLAANKIKLEDKLYQVFRYSLLLDGWEMVFCGSLENTPQLEKTQKAMMAMIFIFLTFMALAFAILFYVLLRDRKQRDQISKNWEESELMVKNREEELRDINKILGEELEERRIVEADLEKKMNELERFNKVAIEREVRIIDLKKEVNNLCRQLKKADRYKSDYDLERKNF